MPHESEPPQAETVEEAEARTIDWRSAFGELSEGVVAATAVGMTVYATTRSEVMGVLGGYLAFRASSYK